METYQEQAPVQSGKGGGKKGFGIALLVIGAYFLLQDLGILPGSLPFWPVISLIAGAYLVWGKK